MRTLRAWFLRLGSLFNKHRQDGELGAELESHLAMHVEDNRRAGMTPEEARRQALLKLGGIEQTKESYRDRRGLPFLETFFRDLRYGSRMLVKNSGFTVVAVLTLALGIGVNTTIFSLVSSMLLRKPPVENPDRLMMLLSKNPGAASPADEASRMPVSVPDFLDWRAQATFFSGMAAMSTDDFTLTGGSEPERAAGAQVSANYFRVMGVAPILGRAFVTGEDQAEHSHVVVLREDLWRRRFGADPQVLGRVVKVNGQGYAVVGVIPASFQMWAFPSKIWIPLVFTSDQRVPAARKNRSLSVFGRLKPGVTESQARAELATIARRIAASHPESDKGWGSNLMPIEQYLVEESNSKPALIFLTAAVAFVLLIACANLANLLLARNSNRQREFAIRTALGAGRFRLARQLFAECLMLAIAGGGLGLLFAVWGLRVLRAALNWNEYSAILAQQVSIDGNVLAFTLAVSLAAALVFGLAPILQVSRRDPNAGLKESSRSATASHKHQRLQNVLVVGELALSMILLVGAGLFVGSFIEELEADRGMSPDHVLTASVSLTGTAYKEPAAQVDFFQNVLRRLAGFPEVQSAAVATDLPFTLPSEAHIAVEGRPVPETEKQARAGYFAVSPAYFSVTQIPLREGREFMLSDNANSAPVAIVNEAFAQKFFPNENPLGRHISINREGIPVAWVPGGTALRGASAARWSEIVGVVGNVDEYLGEVAPRPHIFASFLQQPDTSMNLVVRLGTDPSAFAGSLRRAVWSVDKDQPVTNLRTMDRVLQDAGQGDNLMAGLMAAFAGIALLMAAVGIYGLIAYLVGQRTHEIGVRMALGARRREVLALVLRDSISLALAGVGIGFVVSLTLPRLVTATFQGFHVQSGPILVSTPLAVILVALASCYFPARRASRVDPTTALRCE